MKTYQEMAEALLAKFIETVDYIDWASREFGLDNDAQIQANRQLIRDVEAKLNPFRIIPGACKNPGMHKPECRCNSV